MKKHIIYPAVFYKDGDWYSVYFPDLPGCVTCGKTIEEAYLMAGDALDLWFKGDTSKHAPPSHPNDIHPTEKDSFVSLVRAMVYKNNLDND